MENVKIFGLRIDNVDMKDAVKIVEAYLKGSKAKAIYTPNTEIVMKAKEDERIRNIINGGDLVIADGIGLIYGSRMGKKPLKERVTGFDLSINLLKLADENGYSLFLLGGQEGVAEKAGQNIRKTYPNIRIAGYHHGYFEGSHRGKPDSQEEDKIISTINKAKADIIFVGLGFPGQEIWIHINKGSLDCKVIIGNGGTLDILAGRIKRAPEIFQRLGLEWFYRLLSQPSRIKRQIALPKFLLSILFNKDMVS